MVSFQICIFVGTWTWNWSQDFNPIVLIWGASFLNGDFFAKLPSLCILSLLSIFPNPCFSSILIWLVYLISVSVSSLPLHLWLHTWFPCSLVQFLFPHCLNHYTSHVNSLQYPAWLAGCISGLPHKITTLFIFLLESVSWFLQVKHNRPFFHLIFILEIL